MTHAGVRRRRNRGWAAFGKPGAQTRDEQDRPGAQQDDLPHKWFMGVLDRRFGGIRAPGGENRARERSSGIGAV